MSRKLLLSAFLALAISSVANAGIIRHVVKPVVQKSGHVGKVVAQKVVHVGKTVAY